MNLKPLFLSTMKAVVIGGSGHFEYALVDNNLVQLVAFAPGHNSEDLSRIASALPHLKSYVDYRQMLDAEAPDIAVINPHFNLNGAIVLECLKRNIHCFCEKPVSLESAELEAIEEAYERANVHLGTMMIHRYEPWFNAAREAIVAGEIGRPIQVSAQKSYKMGLKAGWMQKKEQFGGIIPWVGAHALDLAYWMVGSAFKMDGAQQTVFGNAGQGQVESAAQVQFSWDEEGFGMLLLDYLRPGNSHSHGDDRIRVVGEHGIIEVMHSKAQMLSQTMGAKELAPIEGVGLFEDFVHQVATGNATRLSAKESFNVARWCIEAEALATKQMAK